MAIKQVFGSLSDFINYVDFCPICKKRMTISSMLVDALKITRISNNQICFESIMLNGFDQSPLYLDIEKNSISDKERKKILIKKQCLKYHFFYSCEISFNEGLVQSVVFDKYNIIKVLNEIHYSINSSLLEDRTSVRITSPSYDTKEIILPFMNFNIFSKRDIDKKLKMIGLLH